MWLRSRWRETVAAAGLALAVAIAAAGPFRGLQQAGDHLQVALPLAGLACATARRGALELTVRFAGAMAVVHGFKDGLGEAPLNQRPGGGDEGFPSGHTAAAIFGASAVIRDCAGMVPLIGPAAALAAGLVGASRIETERHDSLQVLVGAAIGLAADRALRRRGERRAARLAFLLGWRVVLRRLAPLRRLRGTPAG